MLAIMEEKLYSLLESPLLLKQIMYNSYTRFLLIRTSLLQIVTTHAPAVAGRNIKIVVEKDK